MKTKIKMYVASLFAIVIMSIIFIMNLVLSREYNLIWIMLSGGGYMPDYLGESYTTVFEKFQIYRLVTYGYTQTAIWHLLANIFGLWYVALYLGKKIGVIRFMIVYHMGLIITGSVLLMIYPNNMHYGASSGIFTCLGILANWLVRKKSSWQEYKSQKGSSYLLNYFVLSNILGMCTLLFHLLGFCTGFLLGFVVKGKDSLYEERSLQRK